MGFSISWIAFQGIDKNEALRRLSLRDTGEPDEANESDFSGAYLPKGWYALFSNDFAFVESSRLASLSAGCRLIACNVEEHVMLSGAYFYENGQRIWSVEHDAQTGILDLNVSGTPPTGFAATRDHLLKEQADNGGEESDVDYVFDIPIELAREVCGYRHDHMNVENPPTFTTLITI